MCASSVTKCLGISNADAAASAFSLCSAAARRWPCRSAMRGAHTERDNRGRDLPTMDRTAQRVLGPLRIVDQEMGTRQARPDSFAGDAELDAAIDMAEGSVPALDSRRVRRIGDELVETQDVEKDDVLHARTRLGRERVFGSVQPGVRFVPPAAQHEREREVEHSLDALRKELGGERVEPCGCAATSSCSRHSNRGSRTSWNARSRSPWAT